MKIGKHRPANIRSVSRLFRTPFAASQLNTNMARTASATETHGKGFARSMVRRFSTLLISLSPKMARSAPRGPSIPASPRAADRHGAACRYPFVGGSCFLVASPPVQDLLLSAKHLFVGARPFES